MKKVMCSILPILAIVVVVAMVSGNASAQAIDFPTQTNYFSNNNVSAAPDAQLRIINDGANGGARGSFSKPGSGSMCAMIYVHSSDQQLAECCGCLVTPNGLETIDVKTQLTSNTATGRNINNGVINVFGTLTNSSASGTSSAGDFGGQLPAGVQKDNSVFCDPGTTASLVFGLNTWVTHIQNKITGPTGQAAYPETETASFDTFGVGSSEIGNEEGLCLTLEGNGSGQGVCDCGAFEL